MAIAITPTRTKLVTTLPSPVSVIAKPLVENADNFEIAICADNLATTPVALSAVTFTTGSPTVTGIAGELADVKIGSIFTSAGTTSDFAAGTYVTAKPSATTLTLSTNALQDQTDTTASTQLTVDATLAIIRIFVSTSGENIRISPKVAKFDGTKAFDANGNGVDDVVYADGLELSMGIMSLDYDTYAENFGLARTNS